MDDREQIRANMRAVLVFGDLSPKQLANIEHNTREIFATFTTDEQTIIRRRLIDSLTAALRGMKG